ncbi:DUF3465 domain-containing protein [Flavobacterium sp. W21_SRS_FM6]|uniref:DUF3465 domain-containing protein n=1 Tax=Flavobacterium sp. W21_SRS_FM6 TaxID=3240268 RepID=UPI003F909E2D
MKIRLRLVLLICSLVSFAGYSNDSILRQAYQQHKSDLQVKGAGVVERLLPDDTQGDKHQKFIIRLANRQSILIAHNIDLAPRVANLQVGDEVEFYGEYEWSQQGGVIHWTHHDPKKLHVGGWLKHNGTTYQ